MRFTKLYQFIHCIFIYCLVCSERGLFVYSLDRHTYPPATFNIISGQISHVARELVKRHCQGGLPVTNQTLPMSGFCLMLSTSLLPHSLRE